MWTTWAYWCFVFLPVKRWFQFNSRTVNTHFASVMTFNNTEMIAETRSYIFRWCSRCRRSRVRLSSLVSLKIPGKHISRLYKNHFCIIKKLKLAYVRNLSYCWINTVKNFYCWIKAIKIKTKSVENWISYPKGAACRVPDCGSNKSGLGTRKQTKNSYFHEQMSELIETMTLIKS